MTALDDAFETDDPSDSDPLVDPELGARLDRLRAMRSAWGVLAPATVKDRVDEIAEAGRALTEKLTRISRTRSDVSDAALVSIDERLGRFEAEIRRVATELSVAQLRSTLPALRSTDRRGLLDLLDVLIGEAPHQPDAISSRLGAIDYLVTLLSTRADGRVSADPVTLTPRLHALSQSAEADDELRQAEVEAEFFAAATMDAEDLREELKLRTLRHRKTELGLTYFASRVLRAIVTYNSALMERVTSEILDASDWGIVENASSTAPLDQHGPGSVFESEALRDVAAATRRRASGGEPRPNAVDRIVWALDFDYLTDQEREALRSDGLGHDTDPLGTVILIGLLNRSSAVLAIELQEAGLSPVLLAEAWVDELNAAFQSEINRNIEQDAYRVACALSELKNKFLLAPRDRNRSDECPVESPLPPATTAADDPDPAEPTRTRDQSRDPKPKRENARDLVRDALEQDRRSKTEAAFGFGSIPWAQIGKAATGLALAAAAIFVFVSFQGPDLTRISGDELERLSPFLERGQRDAEGRGEAFVGRIGEAWLTLPAAQQKASAEALVSRLRAKGVRQVMIYDRDDRIRIQALGSQPTRIL